LSRKICPDPKQGGAGRSMDTPQNARNRGRLCTRSQSPHCNVKLICALRQILNSLYTVYSFSSWWKSFQFSRPSPMECSTYRHQASCHCTNIQKDTQDLSFLKTSILILLYFIIPLLVHIASVNSWSSSHVSCIPV